jgi:glyoxylase-like metal-dependent hydrolase (beta-lactamase superfamily II)
MILDQPGKVSDRILMLGRRESCVYLVQGKQEHFLLGGGMIQIAPQVLQQLENWDIDLEKITKIIILHSHFDHIGIVPYLQRHLPQLQVLASPQAQKLLLKPEVIQTIQSMNQLLLEREHMQDKARALGLEFPGLQIQQTLADNDVLQEAGFELQVMEVPGHSSCSIALYMPQEKALFASDATGIPMGRDVFTAANSNFDLYQQSLQRLANLEVDIHLAEHFGARTGEDAREFMQRSLQSARETRKILEESYQRTQDVQQSTQEITQRLLANMPQEFLPQEVISMVVAQMLKYLAQQQG